MAASRDRDINGENIPGDVFPRPDPTRLTTDQLRREIGSLREALETRLKGMDRATELQKEATDRVPSLIDEKLNRLERLVEEKFASVQRQFDERDARARDTAISSATAVEKALQAAKEAVGLQTEASDRAIAKSEATTKERLDQLGVLIGSETRAQDSKNSDLKDRLTAMENRIIGSTGSWQTMATIAVIAIALGALIEKLLGH